MARPRELSLAVLAFFALGSPPLVAVEDDGVVYFQGHRWAANDFAEVRRTSFRGEEVLEIVPGHRGVAYVEDVPFNSGCIHLDVASAKRTVSTISLYCGPSEPDAGRVTVALRRRFSDAATRLHSAVVTPSGRHAPNAIMLCVYDDPPTHSSAGLDSWVHLKIQVEDDLIKVFINDDTEPAFVTGNIFDRKHGRYVGIRSRCYVRNLHVDATE